MLRPSRRNPAWYGRRQKTDRAKSRSVLTTVRPSEVAAASTSVSFITNLPRSATATTSCPAAINIASRRISTHSSRMSRTSGVRRRAGLDPGEEHFPRDKIVRVLDARPHIFPGQPRERRQHLLDVKPVRQMTQHRL